MKDLKIYIGIGTALLIVYLVAQFNKPNPVNWAATLAASDKIPYGTYILHNRLKDVFPGAEVVKTNISGYKFFSDATRPAGNYIVVSKGLEFSKADVKAMIAYMKKGNSIFVASENWEDDLSDSLKIRGAYEFKKKNAALNFESPSIKSSNGYKFDKFIGDAYFETFDTTKAVVLGRNANGNANFIRFGFGKGQLLLLANPQLLTNYSLLSPQGADYAAKALSYLPEANYVYWDQFQNHDIPVDQSPLRVFFSYPALRWAYYVALFSLIIFVLYEVKRRQRIIPVVEPLKNSSLEFVTVVGRVYYEQRDNANIARKKISYFMDNVRTTFGLKVISPTDESVAVFAHKTGVDIDFARELLGHINILLPQTRISDHELIVLNRLIDKFYLQSGLYGK